MKIFRKINTIVTTEPKQVIDVTDEINQFVEKNGIKNGSLIVQTLHTTMGLIIQELTETRLCRDIIKHLDKLVPSSVEDYEHNDVDERPEVIDKENEPLNGKSHIQGLLLSQQLFLDIWDNRLTLGKWQRIGLLELDGPRKNRTYFLKAWEDAKNSHSAGKDFMETKFRPRTLNRRHFTSHYPFYVTHNDLWLKKGNE